MPLPIALSHESEKSISPPHLLAPLTLTNNLPPDSPVLPPPSRLSSILKTITSKSLDNIIAEARRELAEERDKVGMAVSSESLYTTMSRGARGGAGTGGQGYYLDMDQLFTYGTTKS